MKIAVFNESSTCLKNKDVMNALKEAGLDAFNLGMTGPEDSVLLTVETGLMTALVLNLNCVDFVIGGCGTGQGYLNAAVQYPNVVCGLITEPSDAWLFSQINAGNCVSLALNKGYGWAGDINLKYMFQRLFETEPGLGYPVSRKQPQEEIRVRHSEVMNATHYQMDQILDRLDKNLVRNVFHFKNFFTFLVEHGDRSLPLYGKIIEIGKSEGLI